MDDEQSGQANAHPKKAKGALVGLLLLVCTSLGFLGGYVGSRVDGSLTDLKDQSTEVKQQIVSSESEIISQIAKDMGPSVVSITVTSLTTSVFGGSFTTAAAGTGIILNAEGVVITNRHVVAGADKVTVTLDNGTQLPAEIIGNDTVNDLAFVRITDKQGETLTPAKLGDSSAMEVGDKVIAIGNALGEFQNTVTQGIISGLGRPVIAGDEVESEALANLLQTDAAINTGNSGGPLVNMNGEVIGINTAVAGDGAENIGFAIPINDAKGLIKSVLEQGRIVRPFLGVRYITLNKEVAEQYGLSETKGAYIPQPVGGEAVIVPGSPAEQAGLRAGDIITKVGDRSVDERTLLATALSEYKVGDRVTLTVIRGGQEQKIDATLAETPSS